MTRAAAVLPVVGVLACLAAPAHAQDVFGTVLFDGTGGDQSIPYAELRACPRQGGASCIESITGRDGTFTLEGAPPGEYDFEVRHSGRTLGETRTLIVPEGRDEVLFDVTVER